jgi:uncharacterized protein YqgC (DUF456 family)
MSGSGPDSDQATTQPHSNAANTALGVSVGAAVGSIIGATLLPGLGLALLPPAIALLGGLLGNRATRIAAKLHTHD